MGTTKPHDDRTPSSDLLIGAAAIQAYLIGLGWPDTVDPYYLRKTGWPIGSTAGSGGRLVASKRKLDRHVDELTTGGPSAA